MAETSGDAANHELCLEQILKDAKHRWLRPVEIIEILQQYEKLDISDAPPQQPPGGTLFLFDRKVRRNFRKDGHSWRKRKDGKSVIESHEKLKIGSLDVLNCYYAHGEENESFQRRIYWMLDELFENIALVHYREVIEGHNSGSHSLLVEPLSMIASPHTTAAPMLTLGNSPAPTNNTISTSRTDSNSNAQADFEDVDSRGHQTESPPAQSIPLEQILQDAKHRWLRPVEAFVILQNYKKLEISHSPPNEPPGGSLFLFDRRIRRNFRSDGHSWKKHKDGRITKEAQRKIKIGSGDVLQCSHARGERNESFQRRTYRLLDEQFENFVLVHYREVKEEANAEEERRRKRRLNGEEEILSLL